MDDDEKEKDNEQQRRKSARTTAGKDTRKKHADDTELQQQLARTPTKGTREAMQCNVNISEVSGRDMENGEVMTALELAVKMGAITNSKSTRPILSGINKNTIVNRRNNTTTKGPKYGKSNRGTR